jgi:chemotaxis protein methyltransferase CheR
VLIYFTPAHAHKLVQNLRHALMDEGWLAVSPSECSQALFSGFTAVNFPGSILYQKCQGAAVSPPSWRPAPVLTPMPNTVPAFEAPPRPNATAADAVIGAPDTLEVAESLYGQGRYAEATGTLLSSALDGAAQSSLACLRTGERPRAFSLLTRALANQGQLTEALAWSERWIGADKMDCAAHYVHAMILQEMGQREAAGRSLNRAVYLQPEFALAHFALGNLARAAGRGEANRHFENALRLLRACPPDQPLPEGDGLGAGRLMEIIATVLTLPDRPGVPPS